MKGGSVFQQGNRWIYKGFNYMENGEKKRYRKSFATEEEAQYYRDCVIRDLNLNVKREQPKLTVEEAYKKWRLISWQNEDYYSYNTQRGYESIYNVHILPNIGTHYADNLDIRCLYMHLKAEADKGKSKKTIDNIVQALKALLDFAEESEWITINNAEKIKKPRVKKRNREKIVNTVAFTEYEKVYELLKSRNSHFAEIIRFLTYSGVRAEELSIKEEDVLPDGILVKQAFKRRKDVITNKSKLVISDFLKTEASYRKIPLTEELKSCIEDFRALKKKKNIKSEYLFCSTKGTLLEERNILRAYHNALERCNLDKRGLHSMRKLCCKTYFDASEDWEITRRLLGHSAASVTQNYYYYLDSDDLTRYAKKIDQKIDQNKRKAT